MRLFRPGDVAAAREMLTNTLKWRKEFKVEELSKETFDESVFGKVGILSGKDKDGRPVSASSLVAIIIPHLDRSRTTFTAQWTRRSSSRM